MSLLRRTPLRQDRRPVRPNRDGELRPVRRLPISKASQEQIAKVTEYGRCVACGMSAARVHIDPHHLTPVGSWGGCAAAECVIGLCRGCHRDWHDGRLDLWVHLRAGAARGEFHEELAHAAAHVNWDVVTLLERFSHDTIVWKSQLGEQHAGQTS